MTPTAAALPESVRTRSRAWPLRREHGALAGILVLSGLLEFVKLTQNGFANIYYSAAVKSMLRSLHNFFFVSADPNGLITVDKPPLALWVEGLSARVFGFHPLSLLIPEGICAVIAVAVIYWVVAPRFGVVAGLISAFTLAVFPSFVAVSRDNGVDPLLILLMLCACWAGLTAIETGRLWRLLLCALLVGLAFNTKALAALLCVPGIGVAYLLCAPVSLRRRLLQLAVAGVVMAVVCASWSAAVDLTPASQRPFIGSTSKNTEAQLIFGYNGFGRVGGQQGGPNDTHRTPRAAQPPLVRPGIDTQLSVSAIDTAYIHARSHAHHHPASTTPTPLNSRVRPAHHGRARVNVVPFASSTLSPVRILGKGLGDQAGWDVPLAVLGAIALLIVLVRRRRDRAFAALLVLGGWFLIEMLTLDFSKGIVHPYYSSALGPGLAVMVGAGAVGLARLLRSDDGRTALGGYLLFVLAIAGTVGAQLFLIERYHDPLWWRIPLVLIALAALVAIPMLRGRSGLAVALAVAAVLVAPTVYSFSVWLAPVDGTFPTAGPYDAAGKGGYGVSRESLRGNRSLIRFVRHQDPGSPYAVLTESSDQASPLILLGLRASASGGYNTTDPAISSTRLANLVAEHKARYFLIGGPYDTRGGNSASNAARLVCPEVFDAVWDGGGLNSGILVDCRGRAAELRHPYRFAREFLSTAKAYIRKHPQGAKVDKSVRDYQL